MSGKKTGNRILTALIVLLVLLLSLGLLSRLFGGFIGRPEITLTYAGESYKKSVSGLKIEPESEFGIKLRDKKRGLCREDLRAGNGRNGFYVHGRTGRRTAGMKAIARVNRTAGGARISRRYSRSRKRKRALHFRAESRKRCGTCGRTRRSSCRRISRPATDSEWRSRAERIR